MFFGKFISKIFNEFDTVIWTISGFDSFPLLSVTTSENSNIQSSSGAVKVKTGSSYSPKETSGPDVCVHK